MNFRKLVQFVRDLFKGNSDKDEVTVQTCYGSTVWVEKDVLFQEIRHLVKDGTSRRIDLLHALFAAFNDKPTLVVGEVVQKFAYELAQRGLTGEQCRELEQILESAGLGLGMEVLRPTWQELEDQATREIVERSDRSPMGRSGPS